MCLSAKNGDEWRDEPFKVDAATVNVSVRDFLTRYPAEKYDLYFGVAPFTEPARKREFADQPPVLWADIDDGHTRRVRPTYLWQTSRDRYQGLWLLSPSSMPVGELEALNRALTYYIDADHSGWSLTKVLRIPGTLNHKPERRDHPQVGPVATYRRAYRVESLSKFLRPKRLVRVTQLIPVPDIDREEVLRRHRGNVPRGVLWNLDRASDGDRSGRLWRIYRQLFDRGWSAEDVFAVVHGAQADKWRDERDGDQLLWQDVQRASAKLAGVDR